MLGSNKKYCGNKKDGCGGIKLPAFKRCNGLCFELKVTQDENMSSISYLIETNSRIKINKPAEENKPAVNKAIIVTGDKYNNIPVLIIIITPWHPAQYPSDN